MPDLSNKSQGFSLFFGKLSEPFLYDVKLEMYDENKGNVVLKNYFQAWIILFSVFFLSFPLFSLLGF
jgi:hypothetical protein